ncbi:MAG TPA: cytidylate kinase family protein, partial [Armatimonadota bacterium]|nr:cytidylate kinase family protein [Armatimonadota bacterium]
MIITISRQSATNGMFVANLVAERLQYRIFDSELVDEIARRSQVDPSILHCFDEQTINPVSSLLWEWRSSICAESYMRHVRETVKAVAKEGNAIII